MENKNVYFEDFETKVFFYREGKNYYFKFNDEIYVCNNITLNKLKEQLVLPYKINFFGVSRAQLAKVLSHLLDNKTDVKVQKEKKQKDNILRFEVIFFEKSLIIDVYKMKNIRCLNGRNNCIPYILTNISDKVVLLEVTKDWVENSELDYYFLADDLTENEKEFFDSCYEQIRCDLIYNLNNSLEKTYQKKLSSRIK